MADPSGKKLIAVVGGTGTLGSSVARSLHDNHDFDVRVLSRDPTSAKAAALAALGIEVVKANAWHVDELYEALRGCWGLFINIDSDIPSFKQEIGLSEYDLGRIIADMAKTAGIKHVVHASLPAASKLSHGQVRIRSFDDKFAISEYIKQRGFETAVVVNAGWFLENSFDPKYVATFGGFAMRADAEGYLTWETPLMGNDPELTPWLAAADDYGDFVHGVFLDPHRWNGKRVHGVSESMSFAAMVAQYQKVTGRPTRRKVSQKEQLTAPDQFKLKEVNGLFDLMAAINGNFFDGVPTQHEDARLLKAEAAKARGLTGDAARLCTVEEFFKKYA